MAGETVSVQLEQSPRGAAVQAGLFLVFRSDRPLTPGLHVPLGALDRLELCRTGQPTTTLVQQPGRLATLGLADPGVSSTHARLVRAAGGWSVEDLGSRNGTLVDGSAVSGNTPLHDGALIEAGHCLLLFRAAVPRFDEALPESLAGSGLATLSASLGAQLRQLRSIAPARIPVVLGGETGTGKEITAAALHRLSGRPGAFQAVNCGALSPTLVESELFGYRKGAFSGASEDRPGLIRAADRGTLFLDEFADLPLPAQATLLRVLQENEVLPVGATRPVKVDLRVVVATHRDLPALVAAGTLRADLLARVSGFTLVLPPLRERREDLGMLVAVLLRRHAPLEAEGVSFSPEAARALFLHRWPLNIRELELSLATALALRRGRIELEQLPPAVRAALSGPRPAAQLSPADTELRDRLSALLREHRGNVSAVAEAMGKFRNQVNRWIKRFALDPDAYRHDPGAGR